MANTAARNLIAALAAILSGGAAYTRERDRAREEDREEELRRKADTRADEYLRMQQQYYEDAKSERERSRTEATRTEANAVNRGLVERGGTLAEARGYGSVRGTDSIPIARGAGARSVASETIPLVTGDDQIDLDLQRIVQSLRPGGDVQGVSQAAGEIDTLRGEKASIRQAETERNIAGKKEEFRAMSPLRLQEYESQRQIGEKYEDRDGGGITPLQAREREDTAVAGTAASYAAQGLTEQEIAGRLIRDNPGQDPRILLGIAVDAARDARRSAGSGLGAMTSPASAPMQNVRIQKQQAWDEAAVELKKRGQDPERVLGPRP